MKKKTREKGKWVNNEFACEKREIEEMMEREIWVSRLEARRRGQRFLGEVEKGRGCLGRREMRWRSEGRKPGKNRALRTQRNEEKKMLWFNDTVSSFIIIIMHMESPCACMKERL